MTLGKVTLTFSDESLLEQALTHKSFHFENSKDSIGNNERLEFLGDAVLDLIVGEMLFKSKPDEDEGTLSRKRASLVNETILAEIAIDLGLGSHIRLGRGESSAGGANKPRILASAFEAIIGAVFVDGGYDKAMNFCRQFFETRIDSLDSGKPYLDDHKSRLQEWSQKEMKITPEYIVVSESGPDHSKEFKVEVRIDGSVYAEGQGRSKKIAEQAAAKAALEKIS